MHQRLFPQRDTEVRAGKGGDAPAKKCPQCLALIHAGYAACPECNYVFPVNENNDKMTNTASNAGVISGQVTRTDYDVYGVYYCTHEKRLQLDVPDCVGFFNRSYPKHPDNTPQVKKK